jgi:structure-specific recognition protein 1
VELVGSSVQHFVDDRLSFEVNLGDVTNVHVQSKGEVALELMNDDNRAGLDKKEETLCEIRLFIPGETGDGENKAALFKEEVLRKAGLADSKSNEIVSFPEVNMTVPRGKFLVEIHSNHMRLGHKSSYEYKIAYSSITGIFNLPNPDSKKFSFVISIDPPIRQGQTSYPSIVFDFPMPEDGVVDDTPWQINLTQEAITAKYPKLATVMKGSVIAVLSRVLTSLSGVEITRPSSFTSSRGVPSVRCSHKNTDGRFFFLKDGLFFVPRPFHLDFDSLEYVEFARASVGELSKTFDLLFKVKREAQPVAFKSIPREEYVHIFNHLNGLGSKVVSIKNLQEAKKTTDAIASGRIHAAGPAQKFDSDDDGGDDDGDDDDNSDEELRHPKARRAAPAAAALGGDDFDSEEDDDDFRPDDVGSDDDDDDGDSDDASASGGSGSGSGGGGGGGGDKKKKKKKKKKKRKHDKSGGDDGHKSKKSRKE